MKKILHLTLYPKEGSKHTGISGVVSYSKNLIENLPKDKIQHYILCNKTGENLERQELNGVKIIRAFKRNSSIFFQTIKWTFKINPDVIHVQHEVRLFGPLWIAYFLPFLIAILRLKSKVVVTLHGVVSLNNVKRNFIESNYNDKPVPLVKLGFFLLYFPLGVVAAKIVVHEEHFRKVLHKEYLVPKNKLIVIPHGIEDLSTKSRGEACKKLDLDSKRRIILFAGYYSGYKNLSLLIEAFSKYQDKDPRAFLLIASGEHPKLKDNPLYKNKYESLQNKAKELIEENNYRWDGFISEGDFVNYFSAADLLVFPYNVAMASSGIMSLAIAYEKPFLVSRPFEFLFEDDKFVFDLEPDSLISALTNFSLKEQVADIRKLRKGRLWNSVGKKTNKIYKGFLK
jgi:glycosyltransferase involved in cell wall biosynthesis